LVARYPTPMNMEAPKNQDKFRRYRANKKAQGLKEVRFWLPDVKSAEFKAQMERAEKEYRALPMDPGLEAFMDEVLADAFKDIPPL
jgi:Protein  of unknown function (DUF3018)